jgi:hypothetical protein
MEFSTVSAKYSTRYTLNAAVKGATVIYCNADYWYPTDYTYTVEVNDTAVPTTDYTVDVTDPTRLTILFPAGSPHDGKQVTVSVAPKAATEIILQ